MEKSSKKGQISFMVLILIGGVLAVALLLFIGGVAVDNAYNALNRNVSVGQVNLQEINDDTFGKFHSTFINQADWWGLATIFGMVSGLFLSAFFLRGRMPKFGIILDVLIIFSFLILSVYVSNTYETLINAFNSAGLTFLEDKTPKTSFFIANLPIFVTIIGAGTTLLFHSSIPRRKGVSFEAI